METKLTLDPVLLELNQKLDKLTTQVEFLAEEAYRQKRRQQEWDDLKADLLPISHEVYRLSVRELEDVQQYVQLEDLLRLLKRLLRNARTLESLLDQLESTTELLGDATMLSREAFLTAMSRLAEMEQKGYFRFLQGGLEIIDQIVTHFDEEDVRQLGQNIVLILQTVKQMTQPEIMTMLRDTAHVVKAEEPADTSLFGIVKQLNDPSVRKGLAKTLQVLKSVAHGH